MKKWLATGAVMLAAGASAQGLPGIDLEVGGGYATYNLNGGQLGQDVSLVNDQSKDHQLDLDGGSGLQLRGKLGVPILPKIKFQYQPMVFANDNVTETFEAFGQTYTAQGEVELDMTHLDTTLHYGLPDLFPGIDYFVDFGVNLRWLLGGFEADVGGETESYDFGAIPLPGGHLAGGVTLPVVDVELSGKVNTLPLEGLTNTDWEVKARYNLPVVPVADIGVEAGYRSWLIDVDGSESALIPEDELIINLETSGFFVGVAAGF